MSLYVISCVDRPDSMALRMATREAHLAFVRETDLVKVRVGGPYLSEVGAMTGSMLIVEAETPDAVASFVANDPYGKAGLFERVDVFPWKVTVGALG
ncbi:MAG: hypothetical protein RJB62_522 [Pseudomonadota bacterium]|jgi:uncharacterized protein YciI